ncbi:HEPN domain-containing protein [Legionella saoudiensis]|uniref:HEPN domain-containing protein n=1 Tax=Legionella saoudiensis TaxID=1750561 RepID=UPI000731CEF2|nr:HEPN domain-containing protein [Legionella saoudiensis]
MKKKDEFRTLLTSLFQETAIFKNMFYYHHDNLNEKFSKIVDFISQRDLSACINQFDLESYYKYLLKQKGVHAIKGPERDFAFGLASTINSKRCSDVIEKLASLKGHDYKITFTIKNFNGRYDFKRKQLNGIKIRNRDSTIQIVFDAQGFFNFDDEESFKFSALQSAISTIRMVFGYFSFFKNTLFTGENFGQDQELSLLIESKMDKKEIDCYKLDFMYIFYLCHEEYYLRKYELKHLNKDFLIFIRKKPLLKLSFEWFTKALYTDETNEKILMLCIAIEALYGKENSSTQGQKGRDTYISKLVYFISTTEEERIMFTSQLKDLFNIRNTIVHADKKPKLEKKDRVIKESIILYREAFLKELSII